MCARLMCLWLGMGYRAAWCFRDVSRDAKGLGTSSKLRCYVGLRIVTLSKSLIKYENRYSQYWILAIGNCTQHTWIIFFFLNDPPQPAPQIKWQFLYPPQPDRGLPAGPGYETTRASLVHTLPTHIYVQTTWKVNFASDDPFKKTKEKSKNAAQKKIKIIIVSLMRLNGGDNVFFFLNVLQRKKP